MADKTEDVAQTPRARDKKTSEAKARRPATPGVSPMFAQYLDIKQAHPDSLLFFRMGDFYELFFDDAKIAAPVLGIALTRRGRHGDGDVPMCGVPAHAYENYLARLIRAGHKVALCDQIEDPAEARKRKGKTLVRRDVVRIVTPGTLTEDTLLDSRRNNHLAALASLRGGMALSWLDMSTGAFVVRALDRGGLGAALAEVAPGELLVAETLVRDPDYSGLLADWRAVLTPLPDQRFDSQSGERRLKEMFAVAALDAFGAYSRPELAACGALVDYVALTQKGRLPRLAPPRREMAATVMAIDAATRRNLELFEAQTADGTGRARDRALLGVIDRTLTGAGARLLARRLGAPLTDPAEIGRRLDQVESFVDRPRLREEARAVLRGCPDIERALGRLTVGRGGPRDIAAVRDGLAAADALRALLDAAAPALDPITAEDLGRGLGRHTTLTDRLQRALGDDLPLMARDGGFIAAGYAAALDEERELRDESKRLIAALEARYREITGVKALKLRHNNVLGYFVEVPAAHAATLAGESNGDIIFVHRQGLAGAARFTTAELGDLEDRLARSGDRALAIELDLFTDLVGELKAREDDIIAAAAALARLDVAAALAEVAVERRYSRPRIDDSLDFHIVGGRHPVVEAVAAEKDPGAEDFVANDCDLTAEQRLWLLTGPNMAGKSTFLRQNALIAILAQAGAYVPAASAHIGIVDRLFSRVGAADDLARGRSTFMVEMVETATILNQAGPRALVILDEIGRGTATFDGLSIAWATIEHLHDVNRCRGLFATHYHELTALAARLQLLSCHTMRVREWQDTVVFLFEVAAGAADRSYGIHVARLAGLPEAVVARAEAVLAALEADERGASATRLADDLPLFAAMRDVPEKQVAAAAIDPRDAAQIARLAEVAPDALTPRQALELVYELKAMRS